MYATPSTGRSGRRLVRPGLRLSPWVQVAAYVLSLCVPALAWGDGSARSTAPTPAKARKGHPPERAAVYTKASPGPEQALGPALHRALALREEVRLKPLDELLAAPTSSKAIDAAFELVGQGELQLANLEVEKGLKTVEGAVATLERDFHLVGPDGQRHGKYVKALTTLALAHFLAGNKSKTSEWLSRALAMNPRVDYDKKRFPPAMKEVFDAVHFLSQELGKGKAKVLTEPVTAQVWVNGKSLGPSPAELGDLTVGRNLATASAPGYAPTTVPLNVAGKDPVTVTIKLRPLPSNPLARLASAVDEIVKGGTAQAARLAKKLDVQLLLLARVQARGEKFDLAIYAYDAAAGKTVGTARGQVGALTSDVDLGRVLDALFLAIRSTREPPKPKPVAPGFFARLVKWKYFWPVVGAVAGAAAIAGTTAGIVVATSGPDRRRQLLPLLPAVSFR